MHIDRSTALQRLNPLINLVTPIWVVLAVLVIVVALFFDRFLSPQNIVSILQQGVITGVVALGMTIVLIGGQFDLSTGAIVVMAAVVAVIIGPSTGTGTFLAIVLPILLGSAVGAMNGLAVFWAGANSIVATIGMQFLLMGVVLASVSGQHVRADNISAIFTGLAQSQFLGIPVSVIVFGSVALVLAIVMNNTVFGRHIYAVGGNIETARRAGIDVTQIGVATFMLSGALAALSGVMIASLVGHVSPTSIAHYEFPALTAVVLGGTSLAGGVGQPTDTVAAILVLAVISNVLTLLDYQYPIQLLVQGVVLIVAVAYYAWQGAKV